jgi:methionyl aminopeptidase
VLKLESLEFYVKAGKIAEKARSFARSLAKPGVKLLEISQKIESFITENGGKPAFPVNLSANERAAHYTPSISDETVVGEKDVLKVDLGVQVEGFVIDTALTIDFSQENGKLLEASQSALESALSVMKAGVNFRVVGGVIEEEIKKRGFKVIENLNGHLIDRFILHAGVDLPNTPVSGGVLSEGDVFAVEPFATTGRGRVTEQNYCQIYSVFGGKVRGDTAREILNFAFNDFQTLPFAKRWLVFPYSDLQIDMGLREIVKTGSGTSYPLLSDNGLVSQAETTVFVEKDGVKVLASLES